jgi:hypothetical protein
MLFFTLNIEPCVPCLWVAVKQLSLTMPKVGKDIVILCIGGEIPLVLAPWSGLIPVFHSPDVWVISHCHPEVLCPENRISVMRFSMWI